MDSRIMFTISDLFIFAVKSCISCYFLTYVKQYKPGTKYENMYCADNTVVMTAF